MDRLVRAGLRIFHLRYFPSLLAAGTEYLRAHQWPAFMQRFLQGVSVAACFADAIAIAKASVRLSLPAAL